MKIFDDLMHAPCAICGAMHGSEPKSVSIGGSLMSTCSDKCFRVFVSKYESLFQAHTNRGASHD